MQPLSRTELRALRALTHRSIRGRRGSFIIEGVRGLRTVLSSEVRVRLVAVTGESAGRPEVMDLLETAADSGIPTRLASPEIIREIAETTTPSGVLAAVEWQPLTRPTVEVVEGKLKQCSAERLLCLDGVADPGNVGSLMRAADAFGVDGVILGTGTVEATNPKVVRSAVGSILNLPLVAEGVDLRLLLERLQAVGWQIFRAEAGGGEPPPGEPPDGPWVLLMGSEAHGVAEELKGSGTAIRIPMADSAESLNVAVAGGILLFTLTKCTAP